MSAEFKIRLVLAAWALAIAVLDLRYRRIPNVLILGAIVVAAAFMLLVDSSVSGQPAPNAMMAGLLVVSIVFPAYALGVMGAGDVKFAFAMGVSTGVNTMTATVLLGSLLAGLWAAAFLVLGHASSAAGGGPARLGAGRRVVPFGAALGLAFAVTLTLTDVA